MGDVPDTLGAVFSASTVSGWDIALAVLVILLGWIGSIFAKRGILLLLTRLRGISPDLAALVARLVKYAVLLVAAGIALGFLGASVQPLITAAIIVAVVVALALRGVADNFAAGVVLQTRRPIKVGDEIEVDEYVGTVRDLNGRSVVILTADGRIIHVPNTQLLQHPVVNHSEAGARRSTVQVRVRRDQQSADALGDRLRVAAQAADGVHRREATTVYTLALSAERAVFAVDFWHHPSNTRRVTSNVVRALAGAGAAERMEAVVSSDPSAPPLTPPDPL